jgi:phosphoglycerate dehydrogenase-like enzyme
VRVLATRRYRGAAFDELDEVEIRALADLVAPLPNVEGLIVSNEPVPLGLLPGLRIVANFGVAYDRVGPGHSPRRVRHRHAARPANAADRRADRRPELALMRDGSCLVNTARGEVVDEDALVAELVSGRLRAGLDVFADESRVPSELLELPNVVLTPHLGSATRRAREAMTRLVVDNLLAVERGDPPLTPVSARW